MYNPPHFAVSDFARVQDFIRQNAFATLAAVIDGAIHFGYVPVILDPQKAKLGGVHFHFARANPLAAAEDGTLFKMSLMGSHAYVSPDWYETRDQVPTWNYSAVEGSGRVKRLNGPETVAYLERLAAEQEATLRPKPPWSPVKINPEAMKKLLLGIVAFELSFESLEGKTKLSQNKSQADIKGVIDALSRRGSEAARSVAAAMQQWSLH